MSDPFEVLSAELMPLASIGREFVQNHTEYTKLAAHTHTVVWGSRGSGKSIHFRFLEPLAQASKQGSAAPGDVTGFLAFPDSFIGVYINCRDGSLNREEFRKVAALPNADPMFLHMLFERYVACEILRAVARVFSEQLPDFSSRPVAGVPVPVAIGTYISAEATLGTVLANASAGAAVFMAKIRDIIDAHFLHTPEPPARDTFPVAAPRCTPDVVEICRFIQGVVGIQRPFFLLFDEANELSAVQQQCINSLIACRSQGILCVKVASQLHGFSPGRLSGGATDETHDFTTLDLESLYTNHQEAYYQRVMDIANHRLARAGLERTIDQYLPRNPKDDEDLKRAREIAESRYFAIPVADRPVDKANFLKKYAPAIVYQEIRSPKAGKSYAGFDNVVHLSSGIVRSFLDCCSQMYTRFVEEHPDAEPDAIPISIQNEVIASYSDDYITAQLEKKIESLDMLHPERTALMKVHRLLDGLGKLFRDRLMDKDSREPRIISISLKDEPTDELQQVLHLAERDAFLHRKWYRSKRGTENLPCYVLNRRLCPHYNLDLTGFQGRLEVSSAELSLSLVDPDGFVESIRGRKRQEDHSADQLTLFEW